MKGRHKILRLPAARNPYSTHDRLAIQRNERLVWSAVCYGCFWPILLKNSILQEPQFLANAQCVSQLALRIVEAFVRWPVVARHTELRGPPRLKIRDASMGLEFLAEVRGKSFSTE